MKIESSQVSMYGASTYEFNQQTTTQTQFNYAQTSNSNQEEAFSLNIKQSVTQSISASRVLYDSEENMSLEDKIKKIIIEKLFAQLYGKPIKLQPHSNAKEHSTQNSFSMQMKSAISQFSANANSGGIIGIAINTHEEYYQKQTIDFSASVEIKTPNQSFKMDISVSFTKELYESHSSQLLIGQQPTIDPIIINYGEDVNPFENLSHLKFEFDLNNDGKTEFIPLLKQGAGFLALDKNGNNQIDNGSELFGPSTNNGFKELAQYDQDKNNWIDENDAIFNQLKVWTKNDNEEPTLSALIDLNVGAIYLGEINSSFMYQESMHNTQAIQKSNGFFVKEDGSGLGMVNSIDVVA